MMHMRETLENQKEKEDRLSVIESQMKVLISSIGSISQQEGRQEIVKKLIEHGVYKSETNRNPDWA